MRLRKKDIGLVRDPAGIDDGNERIGMDTAHKYGLGLYAATSGIKTSNYLL